MPERQPTFEPEIVQQEMPKSLKIQAKCLDDLPNEILLIIFAKLSFKNLICSSRVSKRIRCVCYDKSLWQKINLFEKSVPTEFVKQILENGCYYLSLCEAKVIGHNIPKPCWANIHHFEWLTPLNISNGKCQLRYLDLSNFKNEIFVGELLQSCHYLEKLSLKYSTFSTSMMWKANSGYLYFENLEVLDLSGCKGLDIGTMRQIVMFEHLTEINFSWPPQGGSLTTTMIDYLVKNISTRLRKVKSYRKRK